MSANHIFNLEAAELGLTSDTSGITISAYRISFHFVMMIIVTILFMLLFVYLDQVLPSEFGVRKHPLFCFMRKKKDEAKKYDKEAQFVPEGFDADNYEETDNVLKNQDKNNESIKVKNLRKQYPNGKLAVDGVSFNMYQG